MNAQADPDAERGPLHWLPLCGPTCQSRVIRLLWLVVLVLPAYQLQVSGLEFMQWDLLLFSGLLAFILGLKLIAGLKQRFENTIQRLIQRKVLLLPENAIDAFFAQLEGHARDWARLAGLVCALAMALAFGIALAQDFQWPRALLGLAEVPAAYIAGTYLGRMASYGQVGWQLQAQGISLGLQPDHVDGVAGLKPIGDYYFRQACIAAIPAVFLALWWFIFPLWPRDYSAWEQAYLALLSLAILIEVLAFIVPIWSFHRLMLNAKQHWLGDADRLSIEINELERRLDAGDTHAPGATRLAELRRRFWAIEDMATWPVDLRTRKRFQLNNLLLLLPLVGDIAKRNLDWNRLLSVLKQFGS